jgi:hypothetical protein
MRQAGFAGAFRVLKGGLNAVTYVVTAATYTVKTA